LSTFSERQRFSSGCRYFLTGLRHRSDGLSRCSSFLLGGAREPTGAQQIVGRERRERFSHYDWFGDAFVNRAAASTQTFARIACVSTASGSDPIKTRLACRSRRYRSGYRHGARWQSCQKPDRQGGPVTKVALAHARASDTNDRRALLSTGARTNRWTGAPGSEFRIKRDPAKPLGSAVARSTPPLGASFFNKELLRS